MEKKLQIFSLTILILLIILVVRELGIIPKLFLSQLVPGPNEALFEISPASGNFNTNAAFSVDLKIYNSARVTAVQSYLNFSPTVLRVASLDFTNSVFGTQWEKTFNNTTGKIQIQATTPAPGFMGSGGQVVRINFQAVSAGSANIGYDPTSLALTPLDQNILNLARSVGAVFIINASASTQPGGSGSGGSGGGEDSSDDIIPPAISDIKISNLKYFSATVSWLTDEPSTSQIEYGTISGNLTLQTQTNPTLATSHQINLTNLLSAKIYYFQVVSKDNANNQAKSSILNFTTRLIGDLNNDGAVNLYDLSILLSNWRKNSLSYDFSGDDFIDLYDLSIMLSNFGRKI